MRGSSRMLAALLAIATAASPAAVLALPATFEADVMSRLARLEADNAALTTEVTALRGEVVRLGASDAEGEGRRRTQRTGGAADGARTVAIYTRQLTRSAGTPGRGRRRRAQQALGTCDMAPRADVVRTACCSRSGDDCSSGAPATCGAECASVVLPFWADCADNLDKVTRGLYHAVLQECQEAIVEGEGETLAMMLSVSCDDDVAAGNCVPACTSELHGDLLLANIDGEDSKYSCELHHALYSWVGSAADGGFLGRDILSFLSSLLSAAAGEYIVAVDEDADIATDVTINPGMHVSIRGDQGLPTAPFWGTGSFDILQAASLSLQYIQLDIVASIAVVAGGSLALADMALLAGQLSWEDRAGATLTLMRVAFDGPSIMTGTPCRPLPMPSWANGPDCHDPIGCPGGCGIHSEGRPSSNCMPDPSPFGASIVPSSAGVASGVIDFWSADGEAYDDEQQCRWTIECEGAIFEFVELDTEGCCDHVVLPSGSTIGGTMMNNIAPEYRASGGSSSTIAFDSDFNTGGRGFRVNWRCPGGNELTQAYTLAEDGHTLTNATKDAVAFQCFQPYTPLFSDLWRSPLHPTANDDVRHCDAGSSPGLGDVLTTPELGGRWFRIAGDAGDALATNDPNAVHGAAVHGPHCGSYGSGWLTGFDPADGVPPQFDPLPAGTLPSIEEGVKPMVVCFSLGVGSCIYNEQVHALNCGDYYLWKLPSLDFCPKSYCMAPSDIPRANNIAAVGTDCEGGAWSQCTAACETAAQRTWSEEQPASGFGQHCEKSVAIDCHAGDDLCRTCNGATTAEQMIQGCVSLAGYEFPLQGLCRAQFGGVVNSKQMDVATVEDCTGFCDAESDCTGFSFGYMPGVFRDSFRSRDSFRCIIYGPTALTTGLPQLYTWDGVQLYERHAGPLSEWRQDPQTAQVIVRASGIEGAMCVIKGAGDGGKHR